MVSDAPGNMQTSWDREKRRKNRGRTRLSSCRGSCRKSGRSCPEAKKQYYKEQAVRAVRRKAGKKGPANQRGNFLAYPEGRLGQETARLFVKEETYPTHGWRRPKDKKIIGEGGLPGQDRQKEDRAPGGGGRHKKTGARERHKLWAGDSRQG